MSSISKYNIASGFKHLKYMRTLEQQQEKKSCEEHGEGFPEPYISTTTERIKLCELTNGTLLIIS